MVASTIVTVVSLFVYALLHRSLGVMGLAIASDAGITMQTVTIAILLHWRRMVSLASLDFAEMGRCLLAALAGGTAAGLLVWGGSVLFVHLAQHARWGDLILVVAGAALWLALAKWVLEKTGSALPGVAMKRLGLA
jgi:putative peptidoglycan lipid II flippase